MVGLVLKNYLSVMCTAASYLKEYIYTFLKSKIPFVRFLHLAKSTFPRANIYFHIIVYTHFNYTVIKMNNLFRKIERKN